MNHLLTVLSSNNLLGKDQVEAFNKFMPKHIKDKGYAIKSMANWYKKVREVKASAVDAYILHEKIHGNKQFELTETGRKRSSVVVGGPAVQDVPFALDQ